MDGQLNALRSNLLNPGHLRYLRSPLASSEGPTGVATCTATTAQPCALHYAQEVRIGFLEIVRLIFLRPEPARIVEGRLLLARRLRVFLGAARAGGHRRLACGIRTNGVDLLEGFVKVGAMVRKLRVR